MLTSLARALAVERGSAQPITTVRHLHVADQPLVFVPLTLAGEANAPLAAMVGEHRDQPRLLVVRQPRNRTERFGFAAALATVIVKYIDRFSSTVEYVSNDRGRDVRTRFVAAPQIWVPNPAGIEFVRLLGRSTRFRRTHGDFAVQRSVPMLGRWLTFLAERAEHPGSSLLLAATDALSLHWASGQSLVEDRNLAALLGWIAPPPGLSGAGAAAVAEDPLIWPPAGPTTDPTFDNEILTRLVAAHDRVGDDPGGRDRAAAELDAAVASQLEPTWHLVWQAVELLRQLPAGGHVEARWTSDREAYSAQVEHLVTVGTPQPRRDSAVAAALRLSGLERAQASYDAQRAFDDPLVMAEFRLAGEAFAGVVVAAQPNRVDETGPRRKLRPHVTVATPDLVRLDLGTTVSAPTRPGQQAVVVSVSSTSSGSEVVLELSGGMGRSLKAPAGSVPEAGEEICYTTLEDGFQPSGSFPSRDRTPWTHGGPPSPYVPLPDDAKEDWS